jgi:hypothetical protein
MALVGGGGAPGTVGGGANPAGIGTSINYIGKHAYAYAGSLPASTSAETRLNFTTGNLYIVGRITVVGSCAPTPEDGGELTGWEIKFDDQQISVLKTETGSEDMPVSAYNEIIIPPFTKVTVISQSNGNNADRLTSCMITGEVYA